MGWVKEPTTGTLVWQDPNTGEYQLKPKKTGKEAGVAVVRTDDPEEVLRALASGDYESATPDDIKKYDATKKEAKKGVVQQAVEAAVTANESGTAGSLDALTAPVRAASAIGSQIAGIRDPLAGMSARQTNEDVAAVAGHLLGGESEVAGRQYAEGVRERAEAHPVAAQGGYLVGQAAASIAPGEALLGASKAALGRVGGSALAGAIEGGALNLAQAGEDAYIADQELTAQQGLGAIGAGAVLAGGFGAATGLAGRLFGRSGSRGATALDSPVLETKSYRLPDRGNWDEIAQRGLGDVEAAPGLGSKLRDAVEEVQAVTSGADRETLRQFGPLRWDQKSRSGWRMWRERDSILEGATADVTSQLDEMVNKSRTVMDEVVDSGLKREHIRSKLTGDADTMLDAARTEMARLRQEVGALSDDLDTFGNRQTVKRINKYIDDLGATVDGAADPADAFIALDKAKRGLQKWKVQAGRSAARQQDALKMTQAQALEQRLGSMQEGTRQLLMDDGVWGAAAADQRAINAAWENFFQSRRVFDSSMLRRVGEDFSGRGIYQADPARISAYVRKLGKQEGALVDQHVRGHIAALQDLTKAIDTAFDVGAKKADVAAVRESAERIAKTLSKADETVKVANQIDALMASESDSGASLLGGALGGGLVGGLPGAALGAAFGMASKPGRMIRQAAALDSLVSRFAKRSDDAVDSFFLRFGSKDATKALEKAGRRLPRLPKRVADKAKAAAVPPSLAAFTNRNESPKDAYRRRVREVTAFATDPKLAAQRIAEATATIAEGAPKTQVHMATTAMKAAGFLMSKIPVALHDTKTVMPQFSEPPVSMQQIMKFARYWTAVNDPSTVLRDFAQGTVTHEQVEALREVYPREYDRVRMRVLENLRTTKVRPPYHARLQLDLLLDLNGAAEPTAAPEFMSRFADIRAAAEEQKQQRPPPKKPPQLAARLRGGMERITTHSQEVF